MTVSLGVLLALAGLVVLSLIAAGVMIGLYAGERGRRLDAQRREGVIRVDPAQRAIVRTPGTPPTTAAAAAGQKNAKRFSDEVTVARDRYVAEAVAEGFDGDEAARDFDTMFTRAASDQTAVTPAGAGPLG